ncbi:MAG: DUF551 domain-containing protein [Verrucomicrobiota bacterium]
MTTEQFRSLREVQVFLMRRAQQLFAGGRWEEAEGHRAHALRLRDLAPAQMWIDLREEARSDSTIDREYPPDLSLEQRIYLPGSEWVPCAEQLPTDGKRKVVFVSGKGRGQTHAYFNSASESWDCDFPSWEGSEVTHWREMPENPS